VKEHITTHHAFSDLPRALTREIAIALILIVFSGLLAFPNLGKTKMKQTAPGTRPSAIPEVYSTDS